MFGMDRSLLMNVIKCLCLRIVQHAIFISLCRFIVRFVDLLEICQYTVLHAP